jgi:genome maintenance exonuclease 1
MNILECKIKLKNFESQAKAIRDRIELTIGRIYITPEGKEYVSVTTVLSAVSDKTWLEEWKKRVGEDVANRITQEAAARGSSLHDIIERHFKGNLNKEDQAASGWKLYKSLLIHLNKIEPLSLELPLWSDHLRVAGRTDCVGIYEGKLSIIDFKSSRREKREEEINNYFLQCALYALMLYELLGIECKQIVVLIGNDNGFPQEFKRKTRTHAREAIEAVRRYYSLFEHSRDVCTVQR